MTHRFSSEALQLTCIVDWTLPCLGTHLSKGVAVPLFFSHHIFMSIICLVTEWSFRDVKQNFYLLHRQEVISPVWERGTPTLYFKRALSVAYKDVKRATECQRISSCRCS